MARLASAGFELNSVTAGVEFDGILSSPTISTTTVRSGTYAGRISSKASGTAKGFRLAWAGAAGNGPFYFRFYLNIATLPSAENRIFAISNTATNNSAVAAYITLDNTGALRLYDNVGVIGSPSSALSTATWYRVEMLFDRTAAGGSQILRARINGTEFAAATNRTLGNTCNHVYFGGNLAVEAQTAGDWFFDDIAVNDSTGSYQKSYPDSGKIILLRPTAAGDANSFAVQVGGTAGSANNFTRVNEVTPDDATTYNASGVLSQEDLFNVTDSGIGGQDLVNVVAVGSRHADLVSADATTTLKLELIKASGGTKSQSAAFAPNSTTWRTNTTSQAATYRLVTYVDPDNDRWEQSTLDTMQIGYLLSALNIQTAAISNVWAMVDYTPYTGPTFSAANFFPFM